MWEGGGVKNILGVQIQKAILGKVKLCKSRNFSKTTFLKVRLGRAHRVQLHRHRVGRRRSGSYLLG